MSLTGKKIGEFEISSFILKNDETDIYDLKNNNKYSCIIKIIKKTKKNLNEYNSIFYEYTLLTGHLASFPYKVKIPTIFYGETHILNNQYRYIIMEKMDCTLSDYFIKYVEENKNEYINMCGKKILKGLKWLHERGILCVDLKPQNFMFKLDDDKGDILYFIDFGIYSIKRRNMPSFIGGTDTYLSLKSNMREGSYDFRDDVESMGYVLMFLLNNSLPWSNSKNINDIINMKKNMNSIYSIAENNNYVGLYEIIEYCRNNNKINYDDILIMLNNYSI